jgi:hypothetical protein
VTYSDVLTRVSLIQSQIAALNTGVAPATAASTSATATAATGSSSFANALAAAQGTSSVAGASDVSSTALPTGATSQLTSAQQQFASRLAAQTGLDAGVVSAWLLSEESGGAAQSRQAAGNNDWLNIGYTDSGTYGSSDSVWSNPVTAADATAGWLKGQNTIPGYGTASSGIQAILNTAGQSPSAQIAALQQSGWASSGYPSLPSLYQQVAG